MTTLVVDHREHAIITELSARNVAFITENLEVGDFVFRRRKTENVGQAAESGAGSPSGGDGNDNKSSEDETLFVIERKTVADLKASICDGRSREQRMRLLASIEPARILYLIEGSMNKPLTHTIAGIPVSTLVGSLVNIMLRDGIKVYKTHHLDETVSFLVKLLDKFQKDGDTFFGATDKTLGSEDVAYASTLKKSKKANMSPNVWFITSLSSIPQVTEKIVEKILEKYPSMYALMRAYEVVAEEARPSLLENITYPIKGEKQRRIGKIMSRRIYEFLYAKSGEESSECLTTGVDDT